MSATLSRSAVERLREGHDGRLLRLALDLHDGALQDIASLLADVRFFRSRLESCDSTGSGPDRLLGCVDDLEGRIVSIDSRLRDLIADRNDDEVLEGELAGALELEAHAFGTRTGIVVRLVRDGFFADVDPS